MAVRWVPLTRNPSFFISMRTAFCASVGVLSYGMVLCLNLVSKKSYVCLVNMSRDQRFHWIEPFDFARARARTTPAGSRLLLFGMYALLLSACFLAVAVPDSVRDLSALVAISLAAAFLIAFPGIWLLSRLPNSVVVARDCIAFGGTIIPIMQVQSAVVGTIKLESVQYPVLTFRTTTGENYIFGLGRKIDPAALAEFLQQHGIHEPQA